jgi:predicted protein tyrosine phosphatase
LVAETLAHRGEPAALRYIDALGEIVPAEADALLSEFYLQQNQPEMAAQKLADFLRAVRRDPWPNQGILRRTLERTERIAQAARSLETARTFYNLLDAPFAIWNCEAQRRAALLVLARQMETNRPGNYTAAALQLFEPHVCWNRNFLELRRACYEDTGDARLTTATSDLDDFLDHEALSADTTALSRLLRGSLPLSVLNENTELPDHGVASSRPVSP